MKQRQNISELTRRQALALAGGFGLAPLLAPRVAATEGVSAGNTAPILNRPIPSTGERLPVVGLGTAWKYRSYTPVQSDPLGEVVRTLVVGGGSVVDTASVYGRAAPRRGAGRAESGLQPRIFIATSLETGQLTQGAHNRNSNRGPLPSAQVIMYDLV
jgi:hypothetical protein